MGNLHKLAKLTVTITLVLFGTSVSVVSVSAQRAVGKMVRQEGSPAKMTEPVILTIEELDGTKKTFQLSPYQDGYGDAPLGKNNERLAGTMFRLNLPDDLPIFLESPKDGQKIVLVDTEPPIQPTFTASNVTVQSVENLNQPTQAANSAVKGTGYISMISDILSGETKFVVGLPHTRLDITSLRDSRDQILFYGKKWWPKPSGQSLILVDWDSIVGVNVAVEEISPTPVSKSKKK